MSVESLEAFAVIGDVIRSRKHLDQMDLFRSLKTELGWVNRRLDPKSVLQPLQMTIGDEFQGAFADLATALRAVLLAQLRLTTRIPLRFGVGHGDIEFTVAAELPSGQSGSAWWAARSSVEMIKEQEQAKSEYRSCGFASSDRRLGAAVQAFLILRDRILADLDERDMAIALGLAVGETQVRIAEDVGIDPGAVSRRKYGNRLAALLTAHSALEESAP